MKLGKIVLSIALVVVGLGMYAGASWSAEQMSLGHWNRLAGGDGVIDVCPSASGLLSLGPSSRVGEGLARAARSTIGLD